MRTETDYIGGIPTSIFNIHNWEEASVFRFRVYTVDTFNGLFTCLVEPRQVQITYKEDTRIKVDGYYDDKTDLLIFSVRNRGYKNDPQLGHPDIYVAELITQGIVPFFENQGLKPKGIKTNWEEWSINYTQYQKALEDGMTPKEAATTTWTYRKLATPLGFTRVSSINPGECPINAIFSRPLSSHRKFSKA